MSDLPYYGVEMVRLANDDEDRSKIKQYYLDTDPTREDMQDTYSRVAYVTDGDKEYLHLQQIQYPSEIIKISFVIGANPPLVEYLNKKRMIWYSPEEKRKKWHRSRNKS